MKINEIVQETTTSGAIAATPQGGAGKNVGTLFGGTYKQKTSKKRKKKK